MRHATKQAHALLIFQFLTIAGVAMTVLLVVAGGGLIGFGVLTFLIAVFGAFCWLDQFGPHWTVPLAARMEPYPLPPRQTWYVIASTYQQFEMWKRDHREIMQGCPVRSVIEERDTRGLTGQHIVVLTGLEYKREMTDAIRFLSGFNDITFMGT